MELKNQRLRKWGCSYGIFIPKAIAENFLDKDAIYTVILLKNKVKEPVKEEPIEQPKPVEPIKNEGEPNGTTAPAQ